jgi:hypothetical protein
MSILTGTMTGPALAVFGAVALGLIYGLALWLVYTNTQDDPVLAGTRQPHRGG